MMKIFLMLAMILLSFSSFADESESKQQRLEEAKSKYVSHLEGMISALQEAKSCASGASDRESLKKCRQDLKSKRRAMKKNNKNKRKKFNKRKNRREKRRKNRRENRRSNDDDESDDDYDDE